MIDINLIRERPEWVKEQIAKLNDSAPIDEILAADERRRTIIHEVEELRRQRNDNSKQVGQWMGNQKKLQADLTRLESGQDVGRDAAELMAQINSLQVDIDAAKELQAVAGRKIFSQRRTGIWARR